jgi:hypothetical protein
MRKRLPVHYRTPIILLLMIIVGAFWYIESLISNWTFDRAFTSLIALSQDNVSEIKVFDNKSPQEKLLVKKSSPKDSEVISEFARAINQAEPIEGSFPFRQLILSHELYLVVKRNDNERPIELLLHLHVDCGKTVYINIVKKESILDSTSFIAGAKSETNLYEWLQSFGLLNYLGCN